MATTVTNRAKGNMVKAYFGTFTAPASWHILLLGGTTPSSISGVADLNTVSELLAVSLVQELSATNYARGTLDSGAATEDDTDDRGELDFADAVFSSLGGASNDTVKGIAIYEFGASDAARNLVLVQDGLSTPTNGGNITIGITDLLRAA